MIQEPKYDFRDGRVINRTSGEAIPEDEPVFVLRGRDVHAAHTLMDYLERVSFDQIEAVSKRIDQFEAFARDNPTRMKEPDTDMSGPEWNNG